MVQFLGSIIPFRQYIRIKFYSQDCLIIKLNSERVDAFFLWSGENAKGDYIGFGAVHNLSDFGQLVLGILVIYFLNKED